MRTEPTLKKVGFILILLFVLSFNSFGQQLNYKHHTVELGLSSNTVYRIVQDKKGYIWSCGDAGITKFDGKNYKVFSVKEGVPDNEVIKITEDGDGKIWYVTLNGKIGYILNNKINRCEALNAQINEIVVDIEGSKFSGIVAITNTSFMWIKHDKLSKEGKIKIISATLDSYYISKLIDGKIIRILNNTKIYRADIQIGFYDYRKNHLIEDTICLNQPTSNLIEQAAIFPQNQTIYSINKAMQIRSIYSDSEFLDAPILSLLKIGSKEIWVGTYKGLYRIQFLNGRIRKSKFLDDKKISALHRDKEGNIFVGTLGDGIFQINSTSIYRLFSEKIKIEKEISTVNKLNDLLFFGGVTGKMYKLNWHDSLNRVQILNVPNGKVSERITSVAKGENRLIIGTDIKFTDCFEDGSFKVNYLDTQHLTIKSIYQGKKYLWLGTFGFLNQYDPKLNQLTHLAKGRTTAVFEDHAGTVWFSNPAGLHSLKNGKIRNHNYKNRAFSERIVFIREDSSHRLWIATQGKGVVCYDLVKNVTKNFTKREGLIDEICNYIFLDSNKVWVATNGGLTKFCFYEPDLSNYSYQNIGIKQGLASNAAKAIESVDGYIYVATSDGLCYFKESEVTPNKVKPPVYITGVRLWDEPLALTTYYEGAHDQNNFKIDFVGLAYKTLGTTVYRYKMIGLDRHWTSTTTGTANYPSLPPGKYKFAVLAVNEDGVRSMVPAEIIIKIKPPFWQTWWFWSINSVLAVGVVIGTFFHQLAKVKIENGLRQQVIQAEQKALQAQMNPHFVFNALNSIQRFISEKDTREAHTYLSKFGRLIRSIFENSLLSRITVLEEKQIMQIYLELESLRFDKGFDFEVTVDPDIDQYQTEIPSMILQPYAENAIWHGLLHRPTKGKLTVSMHKIPGGIKCIIKDNGIGRVKSMALKDKSIQHKSSGMHITKERLRLLSLESSFHSYVEIVDLYEHGEATGTQINIYLVADTP